MVTYCWNNCILPWTNPNYIVPYEREITIRSYLRVWLHVGKIFLKNKVYYREKKFTAFWWFRIPGWYLESELWCHLLEAVLESLSCLRCKWVKLEQMIGWIMASWANLQTCIRLCSHTFEVSPRTCPQTFCHQTTLPKWSSNIVMQLIPWKNL
jgi:hypothetical protein